MDGNKWQINGVNGVGGASEREDAGVTLKGNLEKAGCQSNTRSTPLLATGWGGEIKELGNNAMQEDNLHERDSHAPDICVDAVLFSRYPFRLLGNTRKIAGIKICSHASNLVCHFLINELNLI